MTPSRGAYDASAITVLEGLDPVRKRPAMYIGGVDSGGLHHLVWEILDNGVDEAMNGHATNIEVVLGKDGSVSVEDDGRGIPVDRHESGKPALEVILTTLHAGGKFDHGTYRAAGGLHGVGASVVNALSQWLRASVKRDRRKWVMEFVRGAPEGRLKARGAASGTGTCIQFLPDPTIFPETRFDPKRIAARLRESAFLHRGVRFRFRDEESGAAEEWKEDRGLAAFAEARIAAEKLTLAHESVFEMRREDFLPGARMELALGWTEAPRENFRSFVNGIPTASGGSHEAGLREGMARAVRGYIESHSLAPRGLSVAAEDVREGVIAILSVFLPDPQFQGQTKDRLNNPEVRSPLDGAVRLELERWLHQAPSAAERIVGRVLLAARAREASRAASAAVSRRPEKRGRAVLPGKLSDAALRDPETTELFLVEGDSAGGSAKQARDRMRQAVLPLRGKILNAAQATASRVASNRELEDIALALGCGVGDQCDPARLRYRRVILLADADADGHHITTLLLAYFVKFMLPLIEAGRIHVAEPPLYRIETGDGVEWVSDDAARDGVLSRLPKSAKPVITRFKGLGEMQPAALWETTLNPETRRLIRVRIPEATDPDAYVTALMGKDPTVRKQLIGEGAPDPDALDI